MALASQVDVAVIGAGAAGIGAARRLFNTGVDVLLIEARDRLGGRSRTIDAPNGAAIDLGCGWLHSADRNPWTSIAERLGFEVDRTAPPWREGGHDLGMPRADRTLFNDAATRFWARLNAAATSGGQDRAASELLEREGRWNALLDAISTYINGAELDRVSVIDSRAYDDTQVNWRVSEGYGRLIAAYAQGIPKALGTPVRRIDHRGKELTIDTDRGSLKARRVIVTVPTNVLTEDAIGFDPALPDKQAAAAGLPLGNAEKVFLSVGGAGEFPCNARFFGTAERTRTATYHMRPFGRSMIEAYFGGRLARELAGAGAAAMAAFAIDEIAGVLGSSMRRRLTRIASSGWAVDPFSRGSYSHALPGHAGARAILAAPVDGRLFFAGEACSPHDFSTAHGALLSGQAAAQAVLEARTIKAAASADPAPRLN